MGSPLIQRAVVDMEKKIKISIVIPTHNSAIFLPVLLESINKQAYKNFEVIIADNDSSDETFKVAKMYNVRYLSLKGPSPQVSQQRNKGAIHAKGEYLFFVDHDMELSDDLLEKFVADVNKTKGKIDAWYVPEKILARYKLLSAVRTFENSFYNDSVIGAVRIIKNEIFLRSNMYDPYVSDGPADWDLDISLRRMKCRRKTTRGVIFHHEERLSLYQYIAKKKWYLTGINKYKEKWSRYSDVYNLVVVKQFSFRYRFFTVFMENNKWKRLIQELHLYFLLLCFKSFLGLMYITRKRK